MNGESQKRLADASGPILQRVFAATALLSIAACSGGSSPELGARASAVLSGTMRFVIPATSSQARRTRGRFFLSPSAESVEVSVTGITQPVIADISSTSALCSNSGTARSCSVGVQAPEGVDTFTASLFAGPDATGAVLGTGTKTERITGGSPFSITLDVSGHGTSVAITAAETQFFVGTPASTPITLTVFDAGGNAIDGTYAAPVTLTDSDTTGTFTVSPTVITNSATVITLSYSGGSGATSATISASGANIPITSVSAQTVTAVPPPSQIPTHPPAPTSTPAPAILPASAAPITPAPLAPATPSASPVATASG